ncbi:hypothetical protein [Streptomyces ureilyticus]|uniref:Uncharacterized protein n=1 Tax=Streptomyces ureilyticus TaxID=1775131 RepID=A0ABX0DMJ5_9ACTN|nr:hypothetical protein [Streptomyces ureilyticus]NGO41915.1 hypothetical protein [Streptomyces ureilyticus]
MATLVGAASLVIHHNIETPRPYQVAFSTVGDKCHEDSEDEDSGLILDRRSGQVLHCGFAGFGGSGSVGPDYYGPQGVFAGDEVYRVTKLSLPLARGDGLSDADQDAVERLVEKIARENGQKESPPLLERVTWELGLNGLVLGLTLLIALALRGYYMDL